MGSTAAKYTEQRRVISGRRAAAATAQEENMEDYNASIDRISSLVLFAEKYFSQRHFFRLSKAYKTNYFWPNRFSAMHE